MTLIDDASIEHAYKMGRDCALNGANTTNCHFALFATPALTRAWERGKKRGRAMTLTDDELITDLKALVAKFHEGWHDGIESDASELVLLHNVIDRLAAIPREPTLVRCPSCGDEWRKP